MHEEQLHACYTSLLKCLNSTYMKTWCGVCLQQPGVGDGAGGAAVQYNTAGAAAGGRYSAINQGGTHHNLIKVVHANSLGRVIRFSFKILKRD